MSYGAGEEPTNRLPSVFKRLGSLPVTAAATANISNMNEQPVHMYSEPPPSSNGPMGIRIASRSTYFQQRAPPPQAAYYPQATPMYNSMNYSSASIPPQVSTSSFYNGHPRSLRNTHEYIPPSSSGSPSISMVPSPSENGSLHFGHDVSTIKNPATSRQIYSFLGNNSQPTPYHYNPYQEEEIQWGNKNIVHVARKSNKSSRSENQISSPTSSSSTEAPRYRKKDSRLDIAKNIQIVAYKNPAVVSSSVATTDLDDDDDMDGSNDDDSSQEHSPVIRKVIVASNENRSYSSSSERKNSRNHDREHSVEDRRRPVHSRQSSSGENESKVRKGDYYVPDYDKRPLPPKAPLTKGVRRTNRSPDRQQRSRRTLSRSPSLSPDRYRRSSRRSSRSSSRSSHRSRSRSRSRSYTRSISISLSLSPSPSRSRSRSLSPSRRSRSRSASPERYQRRPRRNSSRSPSRQDSIRSNSSSTTTSTNINDRLNLDKVAANVVTAMTTGSISTTSSNSNSNNNNNNHSRQSSDSSGVSVRYQNKTWVNTNEKLPLSKKFTPKEQQQQQQQQFSGESAVPKKAVMDKAKSQFPPAATDGAHVSYNKIWVNSNNKSSNNTPSSSSSVASSLSNSKKPQQETKRRDLRYQQPIISEPLPPSKKFSNQSKPVAPLTKTTTLASSASSATKPQTANTVVSTKQVKSIGSASVPAKSNEKSKVVDNKQKSTTATATATTTATSTKTVATKAASTSSLPKAPTPVKANNDQNKQRATSTSTTSAATNASNASNAVAGTATAPVGAPEVKIPVKKQVGCFKTTLKKVVESKVEPNTELVNELCPIKVEQDTEHKMMMNLKKDKTDNMETDSVVGNHNGSNGSSNKRNLLPDTLTNTTVDTVIDTPMTEQSQNITEKRLSDVPELVQSKKRKVQVTPPRIVEESDAMDTDYVESPLDDPMLSVTNDSLQNNGNAAESTSSSSSSSLSSVTDTHLSETDTLVAVPNASVKSTSHTLSKEIAQVAEDSSPIPMVVDPPSSPKATDPSSNRLNVPMVIPASNESTVSSTRSTPSHSLTTRDVYEKEDILEQIFGESSSRDVTPEFHQAPPSSVNKTIHLSESVAAAATGGNGGKSKNVNKSHIVTKTSDPEAAVTSTKFGNITSPAIESSTISPAMTETKNILNNTTIHADANNKPETTATVPIATSGQKANDTLLLNQATHDNLSNGSSKMTTHLDQSLQNASVPESANVATSQTQETNRIADHHNTSNATHSSPSTRNTPTIITTTTTTSIEKSAIPSSSSPTSSLPSPPVAATPARRRPRSRILPKPWVIRMHDTGDMYFFNMETGESSDVRPVI